MTENMKHLQGKTSLDFTDEELENMTEEELDYLFTNSHNKLKADGAYDNARVMDESMPLDPDNPDDKVLGMTLGIFEK